MSALKLFDTVAIIKPIAIERLRLVEPEYISIENLPMGQVGTIVEIYDQEEFHYLVEFADTNGHEYALAALKAEELLELHYEFAVLAHDKNLN